MPRFAGYLRVDELNSDGSIIHLYPQASAQPEILAAASTLRLDARPGQAAGAGARADGTPLIIAIAASKPLVLKHTPDTVEATSARYLLDLESAISAEQSAGAEVTATLVDVGARGPGGQGTVGN
jgi:hypothetical protein